ncbi:MAG TPA: adenosylcobinamide-GDP ribazoletransferase [Candidatus Bathyarchaeia archaeon]|nr:adenosylcobinamide-GDP ribazoletransferase [Candidatus Bathyarchaeia archaeon]
MRITLVRELRSLRASFGLLTRFPLAGGPANDAELGHALAYFPIAGAALGLVLVASAFVLRSHLSPRMLAVVLAALLAALDGALHLDGLGDVFDGLAGGHGDRERVLAIMRDSRIGAAGATAIGLVLIAKVTALSEALERGDLAALVAFPAVARAVVVPLVTLMPYARDQGLGRAFAHHGGMPETGLAAVVLVPVLLCAGPPVLSPLVAALATALGVGLWLRRRIGGLTGDVYGAAIELAEVVFLAARAAAG